MKYAQLYIRLWKRHQIPTRAAALTYTFILGLVPAIAVCLSIFSFFVDIKQRQNQLKFFLLKNLTAGAGTEVTRYLDSFLQNVRFRTIGFVGVGALLVTSLLLLSSIEGSINHIWSIRSGKRVWKRVLIYNLILILGPICVSLSIAATAFVMHYAPRYMVQANIGSMVVNTIFLSLTYKIFPNCRVRSWTALLSGFMAMLAGELLKRGYTGYTAKALLYNKLYGGLAALPFFLVWIYLNWLIFLSGALLNYVIQNRKSFRTKGPEPHAK